jgi:hypothetical protein
VVHLGCDPSRGSGVKLHGLFGLVLDGADLDLLAGKGTVDLEGVGLRKRGGGEGAAGKGDQREGVGKVALDLKAQPTTLSSHLFISTTPDDVVLSRSSLIGIHSIILARGKSAKENKGQKYALKG